MVYSEPSVNIETLCSNAEKVQSSLSRHRNSTSDDYLDPRQAPRIDAGSLAELCLCAPLAKPMWMYGDADGQDKLVCQNCGTMSISFVGVDKEYTLHSGDDNKVNQAKMRHVTVRDQAQVSEMFKLNPNEINGSVILTEQLLRHANNRLCQSLVWCKVLGKERAGPDQISITNSEAREVHRAVRAATKVWINLPESERIDVKFGSPVLWVCALVLTVVARRNGGSFTLPTEALCSMATMRALHKHLGAFKHDVEYQAEEAKEVDTGSRQPSSARAALRYTTHTVKRSASYHSLGKGPMVLNTKMKELSKLLIAGEVWPNPNYDPNVEYEDGKEERPFLGLDKRVMLFHKPPCSACNKQLQASAQSFRALKRKPLGLNPYTKPQGRATMMLPDNPPPPPAADKKDSEYEDEGDEWVPEETEAQQAAQFKAETAATKSAKVAKERAELTMHALDKDMVVGAMQASMQAEHAKDVAAGGVSNDSEAESPVYSEAEEEEETCSNEDGAKTRESSSLSTPAASSSSAAAAANPDMCSDDEGDATECDDESVGPGSVVVGDYDSEKDTVPEDMDSDDDVWEAATREEAERQGEEEVVEEEPPSADSLFASMLATAEATPASEMPFALVSDKKLPAASRKRVNEDGDIDVLYGLRMYTCKEYALVARLTRSQAIASANFQRGGAKADSWLSTYITLRKAFLKKARAKLEKQGKRAAAVAAAAAARVAKRQEVVASRAALTQGVIDRKGERQFKAMEKAKAKAQAAAAKGDTAAYYWEPTTVLDGKKTLGRAAPQIPTVKINLTTKCAAPIRDALAGVVKKTGGRKSKKPLPYRDPPRPYPPPKFFQKKGR